MIIRLDGLLMEYGERYVMPPSLWCQRERLCFSCCYWEVFAVRKEGLLISVLEMETIRGTRITEKKAECSGHPQWIHPVNLIRCR